MKNCNNCECRLGVAGLKFFTCIHVRTSGKEQELYFCDKHCYGKALNHKQSLFETVKFTNKYGKPRTKLKLTKPKFIGFKEYATY